MLLHSRSLYAEPYPHYQHDDGRIAILACQCGDFDCNSIAIRMLVLHDRVIWDQFTQRRRPKWNYSDLEFSFDRAQYDSTVESTRVELERRMKDADI